MVTQAQEEKASRLIIPKGTYKSVLNCAPLSWTTEDGPEMSQPDWVYATLNCPKCRVPVSISKKLSTIDVHGIVAPMFACPHPKCGFVRSVRLDGWTPLWCIAFERFTGVEDRHPRWVPNLHYCHGLTVEDARAEFWNCENMHRKRTRIVAIGPVVGYNSQDDDGKVVSV